MHLLCMESGALLTLSVSRARTDLLGWTDAVSVM
jgi:hypothetical protein